MDFYCAAGLHDAQSTDARPSQSASAVLVATAGARIAITAKDAAATFEAAG